MGSSFRNVQLPDNKLYALKWLNSLTKRLESNEIVNEDYSAFINDIGFVEQLSEDNLKCEHKNSEDI